jgi:hypothetical protein
LTIYKLELIEGNEIRFVNTFKQPVWISNLAVLPDKDTAYILFPEEAFEAHTRFIYIHKE